jgi:hypothetical protein
MDSERTVVKRAGIVDQIGDGSSAHPAIIGAAGASRFNEVASVFVRCDYVASVMVNADHGSM